MLVRQRSSQDQDPLELFTESATSRQLRPSPSPHADAKKRYSCSSHLGGPACSGVRVLSKTIMAVREIGKHAPTVVYRGKTWNVEPDRGNLPGKAEAVEIKHRIDRNSTKILRLQAEMKVLQSRVDAAKATVEAAASDLFLANGALASAILFKGGERASKERADFMLQDAKRTFQSLTTEWNRLVSEVNTLRADPARWQIQSTLIAWSYDARLYEITGQPHENEAKTLILQYLARRGKELARAIEELAPRPARAIDCELAPVVFPGQRAQGSRSDPKELALSTALAPYRSIVLAFFEAAEPKVARSDMAGEKRYDRLEGEVRKCLGSIATRMGLLTKADVRAWRKGPEGLAFYEELESKFLEWFGQRTPEDRVPATFVALDDEAFEVYLRDVLVAAGYEVVQPPATRDYGADLIAKRGGRKIVIQAKRWEKNVSVNVIGEVMRARSYYRADDAWIVTTSDFTEDTKKDAERERVRLIAGHELGGLVPAEARLVCDDAAHRAEYVVIEGSTWTLGRNPPADFLVTHMGVSRTHAFFKMKSGRLFVSDNASTAGTFVNGRRVEPKQWVELAAGAKLNFGPLCMRVVL